MHHHSDACSSSRLHRQNERSNEHLLFRAKPPRPPGREVRDQLEKGRPRRIQEPPNRPGIIQEHRQEEPADFSRLVEPTKITTGPRKM